MSGKRVTRRPTGAGAARRRPATIRRTVSHGVGYYPCPACGTRYDRVASTVLVGSGEWARWQRMPWRRCPACGAPLVLRDE